MARMQAKNLVQLSDKAWADKQHWDELLGECYEFAMPDLNPYTYTGTGRPQGRAGTHGKDKTSRRVFDSTLQNDAIKIANRIQFELFPIGHQWATFEPGAFIDTAQEEQARVDLQNLQKVVFMAIQFSDFDLSIAEWLLELVVAGTACMFITPGDEQNPIIYQAVRQSHVAFRQGAFGKIDMISRRHKMRHSLVIQTWPDAKIAGMTEQELLEDPELDLIDVCLWDNKQKQWNYDVIITGGLKAKAPSSSVKRQYKVNPWIISRWNKGAEEAQGRSLVMQALPDARVLSAVKNFVLKQAALAIGGVFMVRNDGVVNANNIRIFPGATIPVQTTGGPAGASIQPLNVGGDTQLAQLVIQDLVTSIHKTMMNDGIPEVSDGIRSATELIERMKELQQSLGAPFARILKEGIVPMLEATIDILAQAGVIPVAAGRQVKLNNGEVDVKFASPLVRGQNIREVETAREAMAITMETGGEEAVRLNFKVEDFGAWVAGKLGVVPDIVRSKSERATLQKQAGELAAAQAGVPPVGGAGGVIPANDQQQPAAQPLAA